MNVRSATIEDAAAIAQIHVAAWQAAYKGLLPDDLLANLSVENRERYWHSTLEQGAMPIFVAEDDGAVCGFASCGPTRDDDLDAQTMAELQTLYLTPDMIGKGYGKALMVRVIETLREQGFAEVMLWALDGNARAIRFYEGGGFVADGQVKTETVTETVELHELRYRMKIE